MAVSRVRSRRVLYRSLLFGGALAAGSLLDEYQFCGVGRRSARCVSTGLYLLYQYKIKYTVENEGLIHSKVARRIVDCCKENEGLYVKFGQALGTLDVALPPEFREPLSELQDRAKTFDVDTVKAILCSELNIPDIEQQFSSFEETPVASASLAQVHRAVLKEGGQSVAVKVQKPNIEVQSRADLFVYWVILQCLEKAFSLPLVWSYDFTYQQLVDELDFSREARNSERTRLLLSKEEAGPLREAVYVPPVLKSSKKILVSEWVDNTVKITDIEAIERLGFSRKEVIRDATSIFAHQIFQTGHVHCDPHPGNLLVRRHPDADRGSWSSLLARPLEMLGLGSFRPAPRHQLVLIDHGLYVELPERLRKQYCQFWSAMARLDIDRVEEICEAWGVRDPKLFASLTQMRRFAGPEKGTDPLRMRSYARSDLSAEEKEELRLKAKKRFQELLSNTAHFPRELFFVGRCINYIRAANWRHGAPIDRIAIFADYANRGTSEVGEEGEALWTLLVRWLELTKSSVGVAIMKGVGMFS